VHPEKQLGDGGFSTNIQGLVLGLIGRGKCLKDGYSGLSGVGEGDGRERKIIIHPFQADLFIHSSSSFQ
jgi:hypothetical protein